MDLVDQKRSRARYISVRFFQMYVPATFVIKRETLHLQAFISVGPHPHAYVTGKTGDWTSGLAFKNKGTNNEGDEVEHWMRKGAGADGDKGLFRANSLTDWLLGVPESIRKATPRRDEAWRPTQTPQKQRLNLLKN